MSESLGREIGLLRTLATHLEKRPLPFERLTQESLRREGLGYVREKAGGIIAIRMPGHYAFTELADCLLDRLPGMERGAIYAEIQTELFNFIEDYVGREPSTVGSKDAEALVTQFEKWFADKASPQRVFVPCVISRTPVPRFEIGLVTFEFIDRVTTSDFYPHAGGDAALHRRGFDDLVRWMREWDADWLARVSVDGCEQERAEEVAEVAVDLVIVALQLAAPYLDTRTMVRLDARRGTSQKRTLSEADSYHSAGWTRKEPGMTIGRGTLPDILQKAAPIFTAVGNVVRSFASGSFRLPALERAWCDAAYWLHRALGESIDSIAIAKLETALEVLLGSESSSGSQQRMLDILSGFFDLGPDDPIAPGSLLNARQFARNIVRDRSRILHGTWSTLNARGIDRSGHGGLRSHSPPGGGY
ncbi:MAG TPA: hypothetical protein VFE63_08630 [Roseiarcus sp.]|jgi:hypothetical protein|nr:hypothetical protein [Roseiarcus sp.]